MNAHVGTISTEWNDTNQRPRIAIIRDLLASRGVTRDLPHIPVMKGGQNFLAYPDTVCILEYYAFEAGANCKKEARKNCRVLAGKALRDFIYTQVGYSPEVQVPLAWQQFHDRVSLVYDSVPMGYFSVFKEIADMVVTLIRGGAMFGPDFVPDISVGQHWAQHWNETMLGDTYGARAKYEHNYPHYFPQAASNPQAPYCYPNATLGEFRRWMWEVYLPTKLPDYLAKKEAQGVLPPSFSKLALKAFQERGGAKRIEAPR